MKFVKKGDELEEGAMMSRDTVHKEDARGRKEKRLVLSRYTISYHVIVRANEFFFNININKFLGGCQ